MADRALFHGIAVVIDDEIADAKSSIRSIQAQIEAEGCHVVQLADIPKASSLRNLGAASFFVVDWRLFGVAVAEGGDLAAAVPEGLQKQKAAEVIDFLKNLRSVRCAPVFIFTDVLVEDVTEQLKQHPDLYNEQDPSHILVLSKAEVLQKGVFGVLSEWLDLAPSAYVLKRWESAYERAKNALFLDFYGKSVLWPLIFWKMFEDDRVPPSMGLGNLIGRNLLSRMTPFEFELAPYKAAIEQLQGNEGKYREVVLKVLEGERFLPKDQLPGDSVDAGDVFKKGKWYYVNIRPGCDCIARSGGNQDAVELYLLEGCKLTGGQVGGLYCEKYMRIEENDVEAVVFPMHDGEGVSFRFKELLVESWDKWKDKRIGRLLPPFVTRLQQRYAAYLQRPGLTPLPKAALPVTKAVEQAAAQVAPGAPGQGAQVADAGVTLQGDKPAPSESDKTTEEPR